MTIYISDIDKKVCEVYASISYKLHLIDRLKANILISNNVLYTKSFAINFFTSSIFLYSWGLKIDINTRQYSKIMRWKTLANSSTIVPPQSVALIAFQHIKLPDSHDFFFHLFSQQHFLLYSYLFDHTNTKIFVHNNADHVIKILTHHRLSYVIKLPDKSSFVTSTNLNAASIPRILPTIFHDHNGISIPPAKDLEMEFPNGIKIYRDKEVVDKITRLVNEFFSIWESLRFVQVPPKYLIKMYLKSEWETKISAIKPRIYPLGIKTKRLVDETFDEM